jgi:hypothetical protein
MSTDTTPRTSPAEPAGFTGPRGGRLARSLRGRRSSGGTSARADRAARTQRASPSTTSRGAALAAIYCPTSSAIHPAADEIDDRTVQWLTDHGLYADDRQLSRLRRARPGLLAARVAPHGRRERLQVFADFHTWLFAFDDEYCDEDSPSAMPIDEWMIFLAKLHRQIETGTNQLPLRGAYGSALQDVSRRLDEFCTAEQKVRWLSALQSYFHALVWEAQSRRATRRGRGALSLDDYALLRLRNGAMQSSIALLDMVNGYFLPTEQRESPAVRALIEMTAILVSWDNDIFSWHKEQSRRRCQKNLLDVLGDASPRGDVVGEAVRLRNSVMAGFVELSESVSRHCSGELSEFTRSLHHWVRANLDFSCVTARYADPSRPAGNLDWAATSPASSSRSLPLLQPMRWWADVVPSLMDPALAPTGVTASGSA